MKTNWLWKESPVMWTPWIQYIVNYYVGGPMCVIGFAMMAIGVCSALSTKEYALLLWGVVLIIVSSVGMFILEGIVLSKKTKED